MALSFSGPVPCPADNFASRLSRSFFLRFQNCCQNSCRSGAVHLRQKFLGAAARSESSTPCVLPRGLEQSREPLVGEGALGRELNGPAAPERRVSTHGARVRQAHLHHRFSQRITLAENRLPRLRRGFGGR